MFNFPRKNSMIKNNFKTFVAYSIFLFCLLTSKTYSQWELVTTQPDVIFSTGSSFSFGNYMGFGSSSSSKPGILFTSDFGLNWSLKTKYKSGIDSGVIAILNSETRIFASYYRDGLYLSTDTLNSWIEKNNGLNKNVNIWVIVANRDTLLIGTDSYGIYRSTNNGDNWNQVNKGLKSLNVERLKIDGNNILAGTSDGVYISTDYGDNWIAKNKGIENKEIYCLETNGNYIYAGTNGNGFFKSSDYGETWSNISNGLPKASYGLTIVQNDNILFATVGNFIAILGGVYISLDNGNNWIQRNEGISTTYKQLSSLIIVKDYLYLATTDLFQGVISKIFRARISDLITGIEDDAKVEVLNGKNFYAAPAFPTPSKDIAKIKIYWDTQYDVENAAREVYGILGNKLGESNNISIQNIQPYSAELQWDCSRVQNGVYLLMINYLGLNKIIPVLVVK